MNLKDTFAQVREIISTAFIVVQIVPIPGIQ